jgi:hypothetical protein
MSKKKQPIEPGFLEALSKLEKQAAPAPEPTPVEKPQGFDPRRYGNGNRGGFDFSGQATLLHTALQAAVPLWIAELKQMRERSPDSFWNHCHRRTQEAAQILAEQGDALMFRVKGKSAQVFNALAEGLAIMSFCPGGVRSNLCGHWETRL